jgi:hypothetical protein
VQFNRIKVYGGKTVVYVHKHGMFDSYGKHKLQNCSLDRNEHMVSNIKTASFTIASKSTGNMKKTMRRIALR